MQCVPLYGVLPVACYRKLTIVSFMLELTRNKADFILALFVGYKGWFAVLCFWRIALLSLELALLLGNFYSYCCLCLFCRKKNITYGFLNEGKQQWMREKTEETEAKYQ